MPNFVKGGNLGQPRWWNHVGIAPKQEQGPEQKGKSITETETETEAGYCSLPLPLPLPLPLSTVSCRRRDHPPRA